MNPSFHNILEALKLGNYQTVYFLQGEEPYFMDQIVQYMETQLLTPKQIPFNLTILYGKEVTIRHVLTQARRFPIEACQQVVIVKEAQEMADLKTTMGQKLLLHYLDHPQLATILVFAYKNKTLNGRSLLAKTLAQKQLLVTTKKLHDKALGQFIEDFLAHLKLHITTGALWMIQEYLGNDLSRIVSELKKLSMSLPAHSTVTEPLLEQYIVFEKPFNPIELQKAILTKNYLKSYQLIHHYCLKTKENIALPIVGMLHNFFSKVLLIHQIKTPTPHKIAQQAGLTPYFLSDYLEAAKQYPLAQTIQNLIYLYEADLQLKGINCLNTDYQILQELLFKLMHNK